MSTPQAVPLETTLLVRDRCLCLHAQRAARALASWSYLVVAGSLLGFTAYMWLLQHHSATLASSYTYVNPVIAVALGAFIAGETFTAHDLGAMAVILAGVVVITLARARQSK